MADIESELPGEGVDTLGKSQDVPREDEDLGTDIYRVTDR